MTDDGNHNTNNVIDLSKIELQKENLDKKNISSSNSGETISHHKEKQVQRFSSKAKIFDGNVMHLLFILLVAA